ncbi:Peptidase S41 family ustP-like protein [Cladobotryum mycophilum]|uniref:Peptidase S41 family ustP-like protein n=1 Tax=Cladobotryum mycophilum TaxID=491253 RepID=A0ABR0SBB9_9HYPO
MESVQVPTLSRLRKDFEYAFPLMLDTAVTYIHNESSIHISSISSISSINQHRSAVMYYGIIILKAILSWASMVHALTIPIEPTPNTANEEPCAKAARLWEVQAEDDYFAKVMIPASVAYDCLKSVPLNRTAALELVDSIEPYLDFQSNLEYIADPPKGYPFPPYDIFAALDRIRSKLGSSSYQGEYAFQRDLFNAFLKAHDGHLAFYPDLIGKFFHFKRPLSLVSVSKDGKSLPVIKLYQDIAFAPHNSSIVKRINGKKAVKYVESLAFSSSPAQDLDAAYNSMFYSPAKNADRSGGPDAFSGEFPSTLIYPGPTTTIAFANGTRRTMDNIAVVVANLSGVTDGASLYSKLWDLTDILPRMPTQTSPHRTGNGQVPHYPEPVISTENSLVSGYYLTGEGLEDVAVLSIIHFPIFAYDAPQFQSVVQKFLRKAADAGKTKLVVDLQANPGGAIYLGYDLFRQLVPNVVPYGFSRFKASSTFIDIANISSDKHSSDSLVGHRLQRPKLSSTWFNYRVDLNVIGQPFQSFEEKFTPQVFQNTPYTAILRWNLNKLMGIFAEIGMEISGYGSKSKLPQFFKPENIVLLQDGGCASTCSILAETFRLQTNVQSVAFGGRPRPGLIQGVGNTKGAQMLPFAAIEDLTNRAALLTNDVERRKRLAMFTDLPVRRSLWASLNARDQIGHDHLDDGIPAQFLVKPADCRMFFTEAMITNAEEIWRATANVAFNGGKCAYGSIKSQSNSQTERENKTRTERPLVTSRQRRLDRLERSPPKQADDWHEQYQMPLWYMLAGLF